MTPTHPKPITQADRKFIRSAAYQAQEAIALMLRVAQRQQPTLDDLEFPVRKLSEITDAITSRLTNPT